jgi:hypothetical protein
MGMLLLSWKKKNKSSKKYLTFPRRELSYAHKIFGNLKFPSMSCCKQQLNGYVNGNGDQAVFFAWTLSRTLIYAEAFLV